MAGLVHENEAHQGLILKSGTLIQIFTEFDSSSVMCQHWIPKLSVGDAHALRCLYSPNEENKVNPCINLPAFPHPEMLCR